MILDSPQFLGLKIHVGSKPVPGSFYCPKFGDTLSHIANWAYGAGTLSQVLRINKSLWNIGNCIYRKKATSCSSPVVVSELALSQNSWNDGAWLALCPGDRQPWSQALGLNYPVLWVPGLGGEEPGDLAHDPIVGSRDPAPGGGGTLTIVTPPVTNIVTPPGGQVVIPEPTNKAKWPWILGLVLVAGVGGTAYYFYRQGKTSPKRVYA